MSWHQDLSWPVLSRQHQRNHRQWWCTDNCSIPALMDPVPSGIGRGTSSFLWVCLQTVPVLVCLTVLASALLSRPPRQCQHIHQAQGSQYQLPSMSPCCQHLSNISLMCFSILL